MNTKENIAVVFTNRAYNALISESFSKTPLETGGILLGHILTTGVWIVVEVIPPGPRSIFRHVYFEYDWEFVNYLVKPLTEQYQEKLQVLGLWHRHPGNMDTFSTTDDQTNSEFAKRSSYGAISGLVNIDPSFRLTMYHVENLPMTSCIMRNVLQCIVMPKSPKVKYTKLDVVVDEEIIPPKFLLLKYYPKLGQHPLPPAKTVIPQNKITPANKQKTATPIVQQLPAIPNQIITTKNNVTPPNKTIQEQNSTDNNKLNSNTPQQPNNSPNPNNTNVNNYPYNRHFN
ncbi:MAG: Mov34/MPN/PAD-1 family protein [Planctomycetaceae bacterium]|jgi:hypothetical protein|nr:Mov34/MPN/PAD-1 family protein [Planctomycetaceae bacterium]